MAGLPKSGFAAGPEPVQGHNATGVPPNQNNFASATPRCLSMKDCRTSSCGISSRSIPWRSFGSASSAWPTRATATTRGNHSRTSCEKVLEYETKEVLCTDVYIKDECFRPLSSVIEEADLLILGAPHQEYHSLDFPKGTPVIDIWNYYGRGASLKRDESFVPRGTSQHP